MEHNIALDAKDFAHLVHGGVLRVRVGDGTVIFLFVRGINYGQMQRIIENEPDSPDAYLLKDKK